MRNSSSIAVAVAAGLTLSLAALSPTLAASKPALAFVANGASDFWKAAEAGMRKAQTELPDYDLGFKYPDVASVANQQALMDNLATAGVKGIMVSAVDPKATDVLNKIAAETALFTTDSDAPNSKRIAYVGSSNVLAGGQAAEISNTYSSRRAARARRIALRSVVLDLPAARRHSRGLLRLLLGFPVLRLRGDYLAIVTLGFGEIIRLILLNWSGSDRRYERHLRHSVPDLLWIAVQRRRQRLCRDVRPALSPIHRAIFLYYVILALALLTDFVTLRLRRLPIGRAWEALREDEIACRSLGINTTTTKLTAFAMGAMFGGFAGSFFAARQGFIWPEILHLHGIRRRCSRSSCSSFHDLSGYPALHPV